MVFAAPPPWPKAGEPTEPPRVSLHTVLIDRGRSRSNLWTSISFRAPRDAPVQGQGRVAATCPNTIRSWDPLASPRRRHACVSPLSDDASAILRRVDTNRPVTFRPRGFSPPRRLTPTHRLQTRSLLPAGVRSHRRERTPSAEANRARHRESNADPGGNQNRRTRPKAHPTRRVHGPPLQIQPRPEGQTMHKNASLPKEG